MAVPVVGKAMRKVFGTRNERMVKRYLKVVNDVSDQEDAVRKLTDQQLREKTDEFRQRVVDGEKADDLLPEVFAVAREAMDRNVGIRNIFNPDIEFDSSKLPADVQALYEQVKNEIEQTDPAEPQGEFLGSSSPVPAWQFVDIPLEIYDAVRELYPESKPPFRARPFDVQIVGGMVLYEGRIAEMKTGEGKTIVAPLATYLAVLEDKQVHVVTVNDYLVQRDRDWTFPFFRALGLTVGAIHPMHMQPPPEKQKAYQCDVVYGTTSEFGFDYLRDNMKLSANEQVQKRRDFAIVDEVDSTLIDEARTPLIISGAAHEEQPRYDMADRLARHLVERQKEWNVADQKVQSCLVEISSLEGDIRTARDKSKIPALKEKLEAARERLPELEAERDKYTQYYEVELDKKKASLTHEGIAEAQKHAGVGSFYVGQNIDLPHLLENSIKAHTVYQRDRDYVVAPDDKGELSVIIVDQNTGRKMIGRQWSDGLHQAVEAKEGVPIKEETQTMATITIQNFFKLYGKLSGMTGTADTEATEFYEIYKLDVIVIPTNVPVVRNDHNDLVFMNQKDKWDAIVEEIKCCHDLGQPVLVGTTSVEKSEELSSMLKRHHGIVHEVLNAKQHEREADIVLDAGKLGAVMIATNMAGRGTDIKLQKFSRQDLIDHWKRRSICPKDVNGDMDDQEIISRIHRHLATKQIGLKKAEVDDMTDEALRRALLEHWYEQHVWAQSGEPSKMSDEQIIDALENASSFRLHRLGMYSNTEQLGGLHVVGTERHESRRIDNQLRGRSGRQGDNGSSRFFLSLEDDLMKMFAGPTTLKVLSRLGMKEGDVIEHKMLTRAVGKAQRKVEERNFLIRKNILEYDEVMDHQRHEFYGMRQQILEGHQIKEVIFEHIDNAAEEATERYLDRNYPANCVAEWVRENMNVTIDPDRIRHKMGHRDDLHKLVHVDAREDAAENIRVVVNEYMPEELDQSEWDLNSLVNWANANFHIDLKVSEVQDVARHDLVRHLEKAAGIMIDDADLSPLDQYLLPNYGALELTRWIKNKFGVDVDPSEFTAFEDVDDAADRVRQIAREAYQQRELTYPIDFVLEMTAANLQANPQAALSQFCDWVRSRYELAWSPAALPSRNPGELREILLEEAKKWDDSRITERAERATAQAKTPDELEQWFRDNCRIGLTDEEKQRAEQDPQIIAEEKIRQLLRLELAQFERWILLQVVDQAWKDHLYLMDQTREAIGFRSFSQRDPRIEFKREGARLFEEMYSSIEDKVTDLVFKAKLRPQVSQQAAQAMRQRQQTAAAQQQQQQRGDGAAQAGSPGQSQPPQRAEPTPAQSAVAAAAAAASAGTDAQRRDIETADRAGSDSTQRKQQPMKAAPTIGRNEPCPRGSGLKYKKCCNRRDGVCTGEGLQKVEVTAEGKNTD